MRIRLLALFCLAAVVAAAQTVPEHKRLLYSDSLTNASSTRMGTLENRGGEFIPGRGWKISGQYSQLTIALPADLPPEGTFKINVTNFDPASQSVDEKQNLLTMASDDSIYWLPQYETGSWWLYRTGKGYTDGPGMAGFRIDYAPNGVDTRSDGRAMQSTKWSLNKTYEFKVVWQANWISFYVDNVLIMDPKISKTPWTGQKELFRYILIGRNSKNYPAQPGPIWSNARIYVPGSDLSLTKVSGDNQNGAAGSLLASSVVVKVVDADGQPVPNEPIQLQVISGGSIDNLPAVIKTTNDKGMVSADWILGPAVGLQHLRATHGDSVIEFSATATPSHNRRLLLVSGGGQNGTPGQPLPEPIVVQVRDEYDNPVSGQSLIFTIAAGGGSLAGQAGISAFTDSSGRAAIMWTMGLLRGSVQRLEISGSSGEPLTGSPLTVEAGLGAIPDQALSTITATSPVTANGRDHSAVTVTLRDGSGMPLSGYVVRLTVSEAGAILTAADSLTNASGQIFATLASTTPGSATVSAHVIGADLHLNSTAVVRFDPVPQSAGRIVMLSGDGQTGIVATVLPGLLKVQVLDDKEQALAHYAVEFFVISGDASFDGQARLTTTTNEEGVASARLSLGETYGTITAGATTAPLTTVITFKARAVSGAAYQMVAESGFNQNGPPGQPLPRPVTVSVRDHFGNPAPDHPLLFKIISGGGSIAGSNQAVIRTDAEGSASVSWTLGRYLGAANHLEISNASEIIVSLRGSPLIMQVPRPALPDITISTVTASSPVIADGAAYSEVTVTLADNLSRPLTGFTVDLFASGENNLITLADSLSDRDGQVTARLRSTTPETKIIGASVRGAGLFLNDTARVDFIAPSKMDQLLYISGDGQAGRIGALLPEALVVRALDHTNTPKGGVAVEFTVDAGGGLVNRRTKSTVFSDTAGYARMLWSLGSDAGERNNHVTARIRGAFSAPITFTATALAADPAQWFILSGNHQTGVAGRALAEPFRIGVRDQNGNDVSDFPILFRTIRGGGRFVDAQEYGTRTGPTGQASAQFTLGERAELQQVQVFSVTAPLESLLFEATATPEAPDRLVRVGAESLTVSLADPEAVELAVRLVDRYANPVPGVEVDISAPDGGHVLSQPGALTDTKGEAYFQVSPGELPGAYHFACRSVGDITSLFYLTAFLPQVNQAPLITAFSPADTTLIDITPGMSLEFRFDEVADPDGDTLFFQWMVNGVPATTRNALSLVVNPTLIPQDGAALRVTGSVSDGEETVTIGWRFRIIMTGVKDGGQEMPRVVQMEQNYPNPFNSSTTLAVALPGRSTASLRIYSLSGQMVTVLFEGILAEGNHRFVWQGMNQRGEPMPSGVYYGILQAGEVRQTRKIVLMR